MLLLRLSLALLLTLAPALAFAQSEEPPVGVLSFIESLDLKVPPSSEEGVRRMTPFVEVIQIERFNECMGHGFTSDECQKFEWSIPFVFEESATTVEEAIAFEWYRFERRSYYRHGIEIGQLNPLVACTFGVFDVGWWMLDKGMFFPPDQFCDGIGFRVVAKCFWDCTSPGLNMCPAPRSSCPGCVAKGIARAKKHSLMEYYPDYITSVNEAIVTNMARSLRWDGFLADGGAILQPVMSSEFMIDEIARLAADEGMDVDPRALAYFLQTGLYTNRCLPTDITGSLPDEALALLRPLPGDSTDPNQPGLPELEELKRTLASKEDAGDMYKRHEWMFLKGGEIIYPQFDEDGMGGLFGSSEPARMATATPFQQACFGYVSMFEIYQQLDVIVTPSNMLTRSSSCWIWNPFPTFLPKGTIVPAGPWTFGGYRFHTTWNSIPEGYEIPLVEGVPLY